MRRALDLLGCGLFAAGYGYSCAIAPLVVFPVVNLFTLPVAPAGAVLMFLGLIALAGFDRGSRRTTEGVVGLAVCGLLVLGAAFLAFMYVGDLTFLREMTNGETTFEWSRLEIPVVLAVMAAAVGSTALYRSRHLDAWAAAAAGMIVASFPVVFPRLLVFFIVWLEIPYTA